MARQITVGGERLPGETGAPVRRMEAGVVSWGGGMEGKDGGRWQERGVERGISCSES